MSVAMLRGKMVRPSGRVTIAMLWLVVSCGTKLTCSHKIHNLPDCCRKVMRAEERTNPIAACAISIAYAICTVFSQNPNFNHTSLVFPSGSQTAHVQPSNTVQAEKQVQL